MKRIVLIEHQNVVAAALAQMIDGFEGFRVVAHYASGEKALVNRATLAPDILVMEWQLPGIGGLETLRRLKGGDSAPRVLVLSSNLAHPIPSLLSEAGVLGIVSKASPPEELKAALRAVARGERFVSSDVAQRLAQEWLPAERNRSPFDELSKREAQVMLLAVQGDKPEDISLKLCLSRKTVNTYRHRIFDKLGVKSEVELTHLALRHGIVSLEATPPLH